MASFAGIFQNAFIPTLMLWTSTECWHASKIIIVKIFPCLRRYQLWRGIDDVSKRERNLTLAKESLQWRRQQALNVNNFPLADRLQGLESAINNLKTRRLDSRNTGIRTRSPIISINITYCKLYFTDLTFNSTVPRGTYGRTCFEQ